MSIKVKEPKTSIRSLVASFLSGADANHGEYHVAERNLYVGNKIVARLTRDSSVILPVTNIAGHVEFTDELLGQIFVKNLKYRRLPGFESLTNPVDRINELKTGAYEDFRAIANLFEFPVTDEDFVAIDRAKNLKARVNEFFSTLQQEELDRIRSAEEKSRADRAAKEAITWDDGDGRAQNSNVEGAGGGQRLRLQKSSLNSRTLMVETSTGNMLTLRQAQRTWEFATQYWHGSKKLNFGTISKIITRSNGWRSSTRSAVVSENHLKFGCQKVTRKEAERFADSMNWPRAMKENTK